MKSFYIEQHTHFNEKDLNSNWSKKQFNISDDNIIAFSGSFSPIELPNMPQSTKKADPKLFDLMLHFVVKHKRISFREAETRRRLLIEFMKPLIHVHCFSMDGHLLCEDKQISISKTVSNLRASLFHIGFFIQKTPDATHLLSLDDLKVEAKNFALQSMKRYCEDMHLIHELSLNQA